MPCRATAIHRSRRRAPELKSGRGSTCRRRRSVAQSADRFLDIAPFGPRGRETLPRVTGETNDLAIVERVAEPGHGAVCGLLDALDHDAQEVVRPVGVQICVEAERRASIHDEAAARFVTHAACTLIEPC